jgi:predicted nucleic acid-binding protein
MLHNPTLTKDKVVVSDAGPLIQLAISNHLNLLPKLFTIVVPQAVFEETQYYDDLPDAIEIAKATTSWLTVTRVRNRSDVSRLTRSQKLGKGEAEAIVLCKEQEAFGILTSDRYAAIKAADYGIKVMDMADVIRKSYNTGILAASEARELISTFVNQSILDTKYIRNLGEEAKSWR